MDPLDSEQCLDPEIEKTVEALLKTAFLSRRKKLRNTLASIFPLNELENLAKQQGISLDQRPQEVSPMIWVELAKSLENLKRSN